MKSFEDLRTVDGILYDYIEAAERLKLLENDSIYIEAMRDACNQYKSSLKLQRYLAMLIMHAHPSNPKALIDLFVDTIIPPPAKESEQAKRFTFAIRRNQILRNLEYFFRCQKKQAR